MNARAPASRPRVIVAVGPATADSQALAAAAQLAHTSGAELAALFVEDINLLRLAELPFAFEIGSTSGTPRPLVAADVERAFRNQADELRRAFSELASVLQFSHSFEIARGQPARALLAASAALDLVVLSGAARQSFTHFSAPNVVREALRRPSLRTRSRGQRPVVAALQSLATAPRVLAAANTLAGVTAAELVLMLAGGEQNAELAAMVDEWLAAQHTIARITLLPELTARSASTLVADENIQALFWPGDSESQILAEIDALLATITCPLVIVR